MLRSTVERKLVSRSSSRRRTMATASSRDIGWRRDRRSARAKGNHRRALPAHRGTMLSTSLARRLSIEGCVPPPLYPDGRGHSHWTIRPLLEVARNSLAGLCDDVDECGSAFLADEPDGPLQGRVQ